MEKLVTFFEDFWQATKPLPVVFFFLGAVLLLLPKQTMGIGSEVLSGAGTFLILISLLSLLIRALERKVSGTNISSQIVDGFFFGLLAGALGGFFGFGFQEHNTLQSIVSRTIIVTVYSVAIGGVVGLLFVLLQRNNRPLVWLNLPFAALSAVCILALTTYISSRYMPVVNEGIRGWEIYIIFSLFTSLMILWKGLSGNYRWKLILSRMSFSLILQIFTYIFLLAIPAPRNNPWIDESVLTATIYEGDVGTIIFAFLVISGAAFQIFIYLFSIENIRLLKKWDEKIFKTGK